jgi:murein DD-endopeptidase MepM/ murein hydrolase activator NlpD
MDLLRKTNNLEEQVKSQEIYIEGMRRMVMSDPQLASEVGMDSAIMGEQRQIIDRIPEDEALRREVNLEDQLNFPSGNLSSGKNGINRRVELHMIPPVKGMVSLGFSSDDKHYGVDVLSAANTPVKTILDGYVLHNGWNVETGHTIFVQHPNEMVSVYKHNSSLLRETGDFVRAGEAIAIIGNTGIHTDGPHLHFELWISGKPADPMTYIDFVREESRIIQ